MRTFRIIKGDALTGAKSIPIGTAAVCVTSPPYYGLRSYGTQPQVWGGSADCGHVWGDVSRRARDNRNGIGSNVVEADVKRFHDNLRDGGGIQSGLCSSCGAWRGELGQEPTPELFIAHLVEVFRAVRRVLRDDGTLWVNIGDSYTTGASTAPRKSDPKAVGDVSNGVRRIGTPDGLKPKDLIGIPWMLAFALRADGWYLRQEIIWHKPNPMPESVTDRCTKAHESIFLLSKSPRYYFDAEAIQEPLAEANAQRTTAHYNTADRYGAGNGGNGGLDSLAARMRAGEHTGRNRRSVWTVATRPFDEAHFAVFPSELITPCILAGSREGDTVYDPFTGSGTTGLVALRHGRNFIGSELNPTYAEMARRRIYNDAPLLNREEAA